MIYLTMIKQKCLALSLAVFFIMSFWVTFSKANETVILQLKWKHQFQFAGYYAAIKKGYYLEEGLDVILIEGKPGGDEVEEVLSERANFGVGMSDILLSKFQGKPVVLLSNIFQHSPVTLVTTRESSYTSPQDLFNKNIQMVRGIKSAELQATFFSQNFKVNQLCSSLTFFNTLLSLF